nr:MAG TPA: hypothetical protein [Bacteriophage sp.]
MFTIVETPHKNYTHVAFVGRIARGKMLNHV